MLDSPKSATSAKHIQSDEAQLWQSSAAMFSQGTAARLSSARSIVPWRMQTSPQQIELSSQRPRLLLQSVVTAFWNVTSWPRDWREEVTRD